MSEQPPQQSNQSLNISDSVLETVQIGGIAGHDLNLTQIQGGVGAINVYGSVQVASAPLSAAKPISRQEYEWRKVLLGKVKQFWIDGVLAKSLHTQVLIELGLEGRSEYIQNPLEEVEEFPSDPRQVFPAGTSVTDIFEGIGAGRTLLILGEPGAGKTVTLLKLAESLIDRATNDLSQPLPVVVNLSSWARQRKSIEDWLAQELYETYQVPKSLGKAWIDEEQLILLLDGLDEVKDQHRNACVAALNQFIQEHGRTEMVVCSRIRDYEALSERLRLRSAIYVQPLTPKQIDQYLEQAGEQLVSLKTLLSHNSEIKMLASSPLILSIMSLAYQGCTLDTFPKLSTADTFRLRLFDAYIERMLTRRGTTQQYSQKPTKHWLIWMARRMAQNSQTLFFIEQMQPRWLQTKKQKNRYRLESALVGGLFFGLIWWLNFEPSRGLDLGLFFGPAMVLFFGLFLALIGGFRGPEIQNKSKPNQGIWKSARNAVIVGLSVGLIFGVIGWLNFEPSRGLDLGLIFGMFGGLIGGGAACLRHFALRFMLYRMGYIPWNYARFLDYAAERLFLQKVGGGYIFVHRMLMEHFAQMELEQERR